MFIFLKIDEKFLLSTTDYFLHFLQSKQTPKWRNWQKRKNAQILLGAWLPHRDRSKRQGVTPPARYIINPQVRHNYITGEEWGQIWEDSIPFEDLFLPWYCHCSCVWSYSLSELTFFLLISPFPNHIFPSSLATEFCWSQRDSPSHFAWYGFSEASGNCIYGN